MLKEKIERYLSSGKNATWNEIMLMIEKALEGFENMDDEVDEEVLYNLLVVIRGNVEKEGM